jgi:hypothetical protein
MTSTETKFLFEPTFEPLDSPSRAAVEKLALELGLSLRTSGKGKKVEVILSSLLWACEQMRRDGGADNIIAWSHDDNHWQGFPAVGKAVVKEAREALIAKGKLVLNAPGTFKETTTTYRIDESMFKIKGKWLQSCKPQVIVKEEKTKSYITGRVFGGKRLSPAVAKRKFGASLKSLANQVDLLSEHWRVHPLCIEGNLYGSATRVFTGGSLDNGGRLYGGWVTMPEDVRLKGTIDGEAVAEVDIRAANLTILTGVTGSEMPATPFNDPYQFVAADRDMVKQATMELLGSGNASKRSGSKEFVKEFGKGRFAPLRDKLVSTFPALLKLEKDVLDSNHLAYIESEIVIETIQKLMVRGITAFPMHDAMICKASEAGEVADCLQDVFEARCGLRPALKIQQAGEADREKKGCYTLSTPLGSL